MKTVNHLLCLISLLWVSPLFALDCHNDGVWLQVLGSGGPELDDGRASSSYLIWRNGRARMLIDAGSGSLAHFEQSKASLNDLDAILLTHLHVDHANDLPALVKAAYFTVRQQDLPVYGPVGNNIMPATTTFIESLFGNDGAYRYLSDYLDGSESFRLLPRDIISKAGSVIEVQQTDMMRLTAIAVDHGPIPAMAWRVEIADKSLVFSGDTSNKNDVLWKLASNADVFIAHHAIAEQANPVARNLHMPASEIGRIAQKAGVKQVLLSHRMKRTYGKESQSLALIQKAYNGPVIFAEDLQCLQVTD